MKLQKGEVGSLQSKDEGRMIRRSIPTNLAIAMIPQFWIRSQRMGRNPQLTHMIAMCPNTECAGAHLNYTHKCKRFKRNATETGEAFLWRRLREEEVWIPYPQANYENSMRNLREVHR